MKTPAYSDETLRAMPVSQRHQLYKNALKLDTDEAHQLIERLKKMGLPFSDNSALSLDDPISLKMYEIIHSNAGTSAMKAAAEKGIPPMAGVDPLLAEALGVDYGPHNMATQTAGYFVAQRMRTLGYKHAGKSMTLPSGCVARSAIVFQR
jgi:hypothetical protein